MMSKTVSGGAAIVRLIGPRGRIRRPRLRSRVSAPRTTSMYAPAGATIAGSSAAIRRTPTAYADAAPGAAGTRSSGTPSRRGAAQLYAARHAAGVALAAVAVLGRARRPASAPARGSRAQDCRVGDGRRRPRPIRHGRAADRLPRPPALNGCAPVAGVIPPRDAPAPRRMITVCPREYRPGLGREELRLGSHVDADCCSALRGGASRSDLGRASTTWSRPAALAR